MKENHQPKILQTRTGVEAAFSNLDSSLEQIATQCNHCGACVQDCAFLQKYGTTGAIVREMDTVNLSAIAYECSLCGLCTNLCPHGCDPSRLFLEARQSAQLSESDFSKYGRLIKYEKRGTSPRFTYYALPEGCTTVLFPGCNLPGSRPQITRQLFAHLQESIPSLGIVLDCCSKPSHDLGRTAYFQAMFGEMLAYLKEHKVKKVLCACPNCYKVFSTYGDGLEVETVYTELIRTGLPSSERTSGTICVHDPCPLRNETDIHHAVREIINKMGLNVQRQRHEGSKTLCCGEGGAVPCISPELSGAWTQTRVEESQGKPILTYCAGCAQFLGRLTPTHHVLDLVFEPQLTMAGKIKPASSPATYWNRLQLKKWFQGALKAKTTRERGHISIPLVGGGRQPQTRGIFPMLKGGLMAGFRRFFP